MKMPLLASLSFLIALAADPGAAAAAGESTEPRTAMVADPCPPPLPVPKDLADVADIALNPGRSYADFAELAKNPEVLAYMQAQRQRAQSDWPNLCRYRLDNAALRQRPRIVFIGDSITEFWVTGDPSLFTKDIVGRGISGQTSPQILLRFFQDVIELRPRTVHIMAGTNDIAGNTGPNTEQDFENNIMAMVQLAHAHHIDVLLASIPPARGFPWKPELQPAATIARLNQWLRKYAATSGSRYIDYYSLLADSQGGFLAHLSNDGVHPNRDGYAVMRKLALRKYDR
jgi:lysophospholipase L1-like esterase